MIKLEFEIALHYTVLDPRCDFVFGVHAAQTSCQTVVHENVWTDQNVATELQTDIHGNRWLRLQAGAGPLTVRYNAAVEISHVATAPEQLQETPIAQMPLDVMPYLRPSRYCQSDRLQRFAYYEFAHLPHGYARVAAIQDWVRKRVGFRIQTSDASTSAMDTLITQTGVCRDFAHLTIALCRALSIPARFTSGLDYGADISLGPPDFHAYVEVYLGNRWYLIDPSGLTTPMGLVRLSTGRDAGDAAFASIFGAVQSNMPQITMNAIDDAANGFVLPYHTTDVLSTDP